MHCCQSVDSSCRTYFTMVRKSYEDATADAVISLKFVLNITVFFKEISFIKLVIILFFPLYTILTIQEISFQVFHISSFTVFICECSVWVIMTSL